MCMLVAHYAVVVGSNYGDELIWCVDWSSLASRSTLMCCRSGSYERWVSDLAPIDGSATQCRHVSVMHRSFGYVYIMLARFDSTANENKSMVVAGVSD